MPICLIPDNVLLSNNYREVQGLFETANSRSRVVYYRILFQGNVNTPPDEQRQAVLLDDESLEEDDKLNYLGSMFLENGI